jgi:membrane protease YdiL (CAAX protease family)
MEVNQEKPVWLVLLLVGAGALVGLFMGGFIGGILGNLLYTGEGDLSQAMLNPSENNLRMPFLVMQGMTSLGGFLIAPYFIWTALTKNSLSYFNIQPLQPLSLLVAAGVVLSFAVVDSAIIEWNQNLTLPDFLKGIEEWARNKENELADLTKMLTNFQSFGEFALAFLVVGVLAGICEEFLFRGIIQRELWRGSGNIHVAIWVSALIFSAIHMQFFGFVPRVLLGALFGYLYYWSGNLIVPIVAHLFNNGFSLVMIYLFQQKMINTDIEKPEAAPWSAVLVCALISVGLLYFFKKRFSTSTPSL